MIESGFKLMEMLIELFEKKHIKKEKFFKDYVEPTYLLAEDVYRDYLTLFENVKRKLEAGESNENIIKFLEEGRIKYLPVRAKLRAILKSCDARQKEGSQQMMVACPSRRELTQFESGILGILRGGLGSLENTERVDLRPYGDMCSHTLLDIMSCFSKNYKGSHSNSYLDLVKEQTDALKKAWEDVVEGFVKHQKEAIRGL